MRYDHTYANNDLISVPFNYYKQEVNQINKIFSPWINSYSL